MTTNRVRCSVCSLAIVNSQGQPYTDQDSVIHGRCQWHPLTVGDHYREFTFAAVRYAEKLDVSRSRR